MLYCHYERNLLPAKHQNFEWYQLTCELCQKGAKIAF